MPDETRTPCVRRTWRLVGWNAVLLMAGLALIGLVGEVWLRLTTPFSGPYFPTRFVPNVGLLGKPNTEVRSTNHLDYWTVSYTNSLGFLDRELISPDQAAAGCHITMIGDSFVEAIQVPIVHKFHVLLESLAAQQLPSLNITTSAFGWRGTGQIAHLPFYDKYARRLHPKVLVLVAGGNDFVDNSQILKAVEESVPSVRMSHVTAARAEDGTISLRPPVPDYWTYKLARRTGLSESTVRLLKEGQDKILGTSYVLDWLLAKARMVLRSRLTPYWATQVEGLSLNPGYYVALLDGRSSSDSLTRALARGLRSRKFVEEELPPAFQDALDTTGFALDQFKTRAERDGVALIILANDLLGRQDSPWKDSIMDWMRSMAEERGIPVISLYDYILRRSGRIEDVPWRWAHDLHWTPTGHRWVAEALLEHLTQHPEVCQGQARPNKK